MSQEKVSKFARKIKECEYSRDVLQTLIYIKKGYTGKSYPEGEIQLEHVKRNICPFCLNKINWEKLEKLIAKYEREIEVTYERVREINKNNGVDLKNGRVY